METRLTAKHKERAVIMSHPDLDPEQLLRLAQEGDRQALGQLLQLYGNYLLLLAQMQIGRRLQGKVDAADLVQETFLAAHRDFLQFRGTTEAELVSWLRRILAARLVDLVRRVVAPSAATYAWNVS